MARKKSKSSERNLDLRSHNSSPMDVELLERLVKLMTANDLSTVDVRDGGKRVVLKRGAAVVAPIASSGYALPGYQPLSPGAAPVSGPASAATPGAGPLAETEKDLIAIKSPMVGTFYAAPSPDAAPFVSVGSDVDEDTDVCIIEAMKVFNNIKAECRGTIAKVLVNNGQTVEFGQVLFLLRPS